MTELSDALSCAELITQSYPYAMSIKNQLNKNIVPKYKIIMGTCFMVVPIDNCDRILTISTSEL